MTPAEQSALVARAKAETLREVADALAKTMHHADKHIALQGALMRRIADLGAGGWERGKPWHPPHPELATAPQPAQEGGEKWRCKARTSVLPEPADCDWPTCGCDPYADKVIAALEESGALRNGQRQDGEGVWLTREEVERLANVLEAPALGPYNAHWLRARLGAGE